MSYVTVEVEIDHGRIVPREPDQLPEKGSGLLTIGVRGRRHVVRQDDIVRAAVVAHEHQLLTYARLVEDVTCSEFATGHREEFVSDDRRPFRRRTAFRRMFRHDTAVARIMILICIHWL